MVRILIGAIVGGLIQFIVGAIAWATPLGKLAFKNADLTATTGIHQAMKDNLTPTGTGTYFIPSPETAEGTVMMGQGPVGLIHFNSQGFAAPMDPASLLTGLVLSVVMLFLIGVALSQIDGFTARLRALMLIAAATVLYFIVAMPVFNFYMPWDWWLYLAGECFVALVAGGYVMLRWFMPAVRATVRESALPPENRSDVPPVL